MLTSLRDSDRAGVGELPAPIRLLREVFTVAVRRCFADEDPREITAYVRELLIRRRMTPDGVEAREIEAVMRTVLGERELAAGIPDERRLSIMILIVTDLTLAAAEEAAPPSGGVLPPGGLPPSGDVLPPGGLPPSTGVLLEALVAQAEVRVARFDPPPTGRPWTRRQAR